MQWKSRSDGNVAAAPVEDWLIAVHDQMLVFQLRYHTEDERGSTLVQDQPFVLPAALAEQLASQMLECFRTGETQLGNPSQPTKQ